MSRTITLTPEQTAGLKKLNDAQQGMQNFMQSMLQAGETRATALQAQGRELFTEIAATHGLDMDNQTWVPSADNKTLVLVAERFKNGA